MVALNCCPVNIYSSSHSLQLKLIQLKCAVSVVVFWPPPPDSRVRVFPVNFQSKQWGTVFGNGDVIILVLCDRLILHYQATNCSIAPTACLQSVIALLSIHSLPTSKTWHHIGFFPGLNVGQFCWTEPWAEGTNRAQTVRARTAREEV